MPATDSTDNLVRIFISYGRLDASEFVDRLEQDLRRAGFEVWRDKSELRYGAAWDAQIADALGHSDVVLAVLSPHAVRGGRRPVPEGDESVCLDELHAARFDKPPRPIIPIMLIPCEPPWIIARLHWLEFGQAETDAAKYRTALGQLLQAIRDVKTGKPVAYRTIAIEPIDFDLYLKAKTRDFVGREWLVTEVFGEIERESGPPVVLLVGEAGWGKTAFAGFLFAKDPGGQLLAAHFCRADRADTVDPRRFTQSIAAMIALRLPAYSNRLTLLLSDNIHSKNDTELFEFLILNPLSALDPKTLGKLPRYLLVDGLDEAVANDGTQGLHKLLARTSEQFPDWLKLVATTRNAFGIVETFPAATTIRCGDDDPRNRVDIDRLIEQKLAPKDRDEAGSNLDKSLLRPSLARGISAKAGGNALVASQLAAAVHRSGLDTAAIDALPPGLTALYRTLLERRFDPRGPDWAMARELLEMVTATKDAVPIALAAFARHDAGEYETRATVERMSDLLQTDDDAIRVFHYSFAEFLGTRSSPFFVNAALGARRLADIATAPSAAQDVPPSLQPFCRQHAFSWIISSPTPTHYVERLPQLYQSIFAAFRGPQTWRSVPRPALTDDDAKLLAAVSSAPDCGRLAEVAAMAFGAADGRLDVLRPWIADLTRGPPEPPHRWEICGEVLICLAIVGRGLAWMQEVLRRRPDCRGTLAAVLARHDQVFSRAFWLARAGGAQRLGDGPNSVLEDVADDIDRLANALRDDLRAA